MKLTVIAKGSHSVEWPKLEVFVNGRSCGCQEITDLQEYNFDVSFDQDQNYIQFHYINKQEHHTVTKDGKIISDQNLEILKLRIDDILLDSWFLTEGYYVPDYFPGFRSNFPLEPSTLKSQLIWHFPGFYDFPAVPKEDQFWFWYRDQRRYVHVQQYKDKDNDRNENYTGSLDPLTDLIAEIKNIINVQ